jgi:raffinose/stachyose/melibiose transport system substrate-binding protein
VSSDTIGRRSFLLGSAGALALGTLGPSGCAAPTAGRSALRFYQQKQEVITSFDGLLPRSESENPGTAVVHDTTDQIAPQFVRGEPADVG